MDSWEAIFIMTTSFFSGIKEIVDYKHQILNKINRIFFNVET